MSLLFENLQAMNEAEKLEEKNAINPQTYIAIKRALNKENIYKDKFFLNTDVPEHSSDSFRFFMHLKCAFMDKVKDWELSQGRNGVGVTVGNFIVNIIDETIDFKWDYQTAEETMKRIMYNLPDLDEAEVTKIIEAGIENVKKLFGQKNFYYRLTNKRGNENRWDNFNIKDEEVEPKVEDAEPLTEDFDKSMPTWLMKAIRQNNAAKGTGYSLYPLDTMKWEITAPPISGKLPTQWGDDSTVIAVLIDISGEDRKGDYLVYSPLLRINNDATIYINNRNRRIETMSMKALAPYIKEFAIAKDAPISRRELINKKNDRAVDTDGSVKRVPYRDQAWNKMYDKSGYLVDPEKYKKLLAQLHQDDYATRLEELYVVLSECKTKIKEFISKDDFLPDAKDDTSPYSVDYKSPSYKFKDISKAYNQAVTLYRYALGDLEGISTQKQTGYFGGEAYKSFNKHLADAEIEIVKVLNIVDPQ